MSGPIECRNCGAPTPLDVCRYCGARTDAFYPRPDPPPPLPPDPLTGKIRRRPEAVLERRILLDLGRDPDILIAKNEVGSGHPAAVRAALMKAIREMSLHPAVEHAVCAVVNDALNRHRIAWGLGVGSPDLIASAGGRWLGLELKSEDGRVSAEQRAWHAAAERRGALVRLVRSVDEARAAVDEARGRRQP